MKNFLKALGITLAAGALTSVGQVVSTGVFDPHQIGGAAAGGAAAALAAWLLHSPLAAPAAK